MAGGAGRLAGRALRGGRWSLVGLALVIALGGGAALGTAVAAHRTDHAYGDYVEGAEVAELVINPSLRSEDMDAAIRGFDGVEEVHVDSLLLASFAATGPISLEDAPAEEAWLQIRGTLDGRYLDLDRPAVIEGELPRGEGEVFISRDYRPVLERAQGHPLEVGDTIDMGFYWAGIFDVSSDPSEVVDPLGVEHLRISGFGVLANEVLPEDLFPRQQVIVSQDVTERYYCLEDTAELDAGEDPFEVLLPSDCAVSYDYYSMRLEKGASASSIAAQFEAAAAELQGELPSELAEQGFGYFNISQERAALDAAVRETTRPSITALQAFAIVAAVATLTVAGLTVARQTARDAGTRRSLRALGATRAQLMVWTMGPLLVATVAGVVGATVVAFVTSPIGPLGAVRSVAPAPGPSLPAAVVLPLAVALTAAVTVVLGLVVARSSWRTLASDQPAPARVGRVARLIAGGGPALSTGVGAAVDRRRAGTGVAAMFACAVATAAAAAALVFGASLSALVEEPEAYGWPWDIAIITGAGYGDTVVDVVDERLAQADVRDDIVDHAFFSFDPALVLEGTPSPAIFAVDGPADTGLPLLEGRMPEEPGEALLGRHTAEAVDLHVGDRTTIASEELGEIEIEITGIGVLPSLGAFGADRTGLGTGTYIVTARPDETFTPSLTAVRLRDGVDPSHVLDRLAPDLPSFSQLFEPPVTHAEPVRSPEIHNASDLRRAPMVLGITLLASLALALGLAIALSVRDRRRELAVLRAIGFSDRDVRRSVRWQGLALLTAGVVVGIPLGIVGGRAAWRYFADRLGVVPATTVPLGWLAGLVVVTLVLGWIAVALPARAAARVSPAEALQAT